MKAEIKIPQMGESITEATIGAIFKPEGSSVKENDEIIELETEKVNQVLYAPSSGVISWRVKVGDGVKIGDVIGTVDTEQQVMEKAPPPAPSIEKAPSLPPSVKEKPTAVGTGKRMMKEEFVRELKPSFQEPKPQSIPSPVTDVSEKATLHESRRRMTKIRKTIANRLVDALHSAAMLTTFNEVDMSAIIDLRAKYKEIFAEKQGVKLGFMSFFVKAVVEGLKEFSDFNSYIEGDEIVTRHYYDIGIAVGTERGLVVPVVRRCDMLSFSEIEKEILLFAQKARDKKLSIDDLKGGGFTITNGGIYGSMLSTPILNPPQVGILGMHKIMKRPVVIGDEIVIRPMMYLA